MRNRKIKLKLGPKLNLIVMGILLSLAVVIGVVVVQQVTSGIKEYAIEKVRGDLNLGKIYLDAKIPGDWEIKDDTLYKGNVQISGNFDIVDEIGEKTGDTVTIFMGNTRVATNVMIDGKRAVGTQVSDEVAQVVLEEQKDFFGEANVVGHKYMSGYTPIINNNGEVLGIFYVGAPQNIIDEIIGSFMTVFIIVLAASIVLSFVVCYIFTRKLTRRLTNISNVMDQAKEGDFTADIKDNVGDELSDLAHSFNSMKENLRGMLQHVVETAHQVASSSQELTAGAEQTTNATEQISNSMQEVVDGTEKQVKSIEESARAMEAVSVGMNHLANNTSVISESAIKTRNHAQNGGKLIEETVHQMNAIHHSVNESSEAIQLLDERSKQIGEITKTISDIADQTNLLALNAAIEAARAGEHGKGFAVVADEVQKLAVQSQHSSTQISELITAIKNEMNGTQQSMEHVKNDVMKGLGIVKKTEENFDGIINAVEEMEQQIVSVASISEEISASAEEVSTSVSGIENTTKNAIEHTQTVSASTEEQLASMEEVLASSNALSTMADSLMERVQKFKV